MRCEREKRAEIRRMTSFERLVSERENLVLNSLIYCKRSSWSAERTFDGACYCWESNARAMRIAWAIAGNRLIDTSPKSSMKCISQSPV